MKIQLRVQQVIIFISLIAITSACASPTNTPTATPTAPSSPIATPGLSIGGNSSGAAGSSNGGSNGGSSGGSNGVSNGGNNNNSSPSEPPNNLLTTPGGPYMVKQIETLGGEKISGAVCSLTQPFAVTAVTPRVTFVFNFIPQDDKRGNVTYAYSIPSAGESHKAAGTYSLSPVGTDGTLQLSLSVSDHVVFKGFDGNIPNKYKFNLVPSSSTPCPAAP
jgi:hypothetical protein